MTHLRRASLLCVASLAGACSGELDPDRVGTSTSAIVKGEPSPTDEDFVVDLIVPGGGFCTGTLIAPNIVLTALHCVSEFDADAPFTCSSEGVLMPQADGAGVLGEVVDAERIEVRVGAASSMNEPDAHGLRVFSSGAKNICRGDLALVVLDTNLSPPPQMVRLGTRTFKREPHTVIGYGLDEMGTIRRRNRRSGLRVLGVGEFGEYAEQPVAAPLTLVLSEGPCHGDSGGPAFSEDTGAITGVYSLAPVSSCVGSSARNVFTQVAPYEKLLSEAAEFAGAELVREPVPVGGAGSGGEAAMGGNGEGGGVALGGSASGGRGATAGSPAEAGSEQGVAGSRIGEGSGSRRDPSCTCRLDGSAPSGASAWGALFALVAGALVRRRRR